MLKILIICIYDQIKHKTTSVLFSFKNRLDLDLIDNFHKSKLGSECYGTKKFTELFNSLHDIGLVDNYKLLIFDHYSILLGVQL